MTTLNYHLVDESGNEYRGTARKIVAEMHSGSFAPAVNDKAWMDQVAERAYTQTQVNIDSSTPDRFIAGMLQAGLLKPKKG